MSDYSDSDSRGSYVSDTYSEAGDDSPRRKSSGRGFSEDIVSDDAATPRSPTSAPARGVVSDDASAASDDYRDDDYGSDDDGAKNEGAAAADVTAERSDEVVEKSPDPEGDGYDDDEPAEEERRDSVPLSDPSTATHDTTAEPRRRSTINSTVPNINVFARVTPFPKSRGAAKDQPKKSLAVRMSGNTVATYILDKGSRHFTTDGAFWCCDVEDPSVHQATQSDVFAGACDPLVDHLLSGKSGCLVAYGGSGTGKSYTVFGEDEEEDDGGEEGMLTKACAAILQRGGPEVELYLSLLRVNGDAVFDLMNGMKEVQLRPNVERGTHGLRGIRPVMLTSLDELPKWVKVARTTLNEPLPPQQHNVPGYANISLLREMTTPAPGRSHLLSVIYARTGPDMPLARLIIADLVQAEKLSADVGITHDQIRKIRTTMMSLGRCFVDSVKEARRGYPSFDEQKLAAAKANGKKKKKKDMPTQLHNHFAESTLTKILKECMWGPQAMAHLVVHVSPTVEHVHDSYNALKFADAIKQHTEHSEIQGHLEEAAEVDAAVKIFEEDKTKRLARGKNVVGKQAHRKFVYELRKLTKEESNTRSEILHEYKKEWVLIQRAEFTDRFEEAKAMRDEEREDRRRQRYAKEDFVPQSAAEEPTVYEAVPAPRRDHRAPRPPASVQAASAERLSNPHSYARRNEVAASHHLPPLKKEDPPTVKATPPTKKKSEKKSANERDASPPAKPKKSSKKKRPALIWEVIREKLPVDKTTQDKERRRAMFDQFDPNGNGYLSLAEIDKGVRDVLGLDRMFDCKPVIMRAYQASKNAKASKSKLGNDYVERGEFRLLLIYLRQYFEVWQMFDTMDTSHDRRIDFAEFEKALPLIAKWGVEIDNAEAMFKAVDTNKNGGGVVLFDEFADWALRKRLDLEDDDDFEFDQSLEEFDPKPVDEADLNKGAADASPARAREKPAIQRKTKTSTAEAAPEAAPAPSPPKRAPSKGKKASPKTKAIAAQETEQEEAKKKDVNWHEFQSKLPTEKTVADKERRRAMFDGFDPNGNGYLSLAEIDKGIHDIAGLEIVYNLKPVIMRAYQASKNAKASKSELGGDYVERREFRLLLIYLRQYFEVWQMFDLVDSSHDRRVEFAEFEKAVPQIAKWGVEIADAEAAFNEIDANGGGVVLFDEFADWALRKRLDLEDDDDFDFDGELAQSGVAYNAGAGLIKKDGKPAPQPKKTAKKPVAAPPVAPKKAPAAADKRRSSSITSNASPKKAVSKSPAKKAAPKPAAVKEPPLDESDAVAVVAKRGTRPAFRVLARAMKAAEEDTHKEASTDEDEQQQQQQGASARFPALTSFMKFVQENDKQQQPAVPAPPAAKPTANKRPSVAASTGSKKAVVAGSTAASPRRPSVTKKTSAPAVKATPARKQSIERTPSTKASVSKTTPRSTSSTKPSPKVAAKKTSSSASPKKEAASNGSGGNQNEINLSGVAQVESVLIDEASFDADEHERRNNAALRIQCAQRQRIARKRSEAAADTKRRREEQAQSVRDSVAAGKAAMKNAPSESDGQSNAGSTLEVKQSANSVRGKSPRSATAWMRLATVLPVDMSSDVAEKRAKLFKKFDPNGNGYLSLAEVDKGIRDELRVPELFDCKPVIMRAFQAARSARKGKNSRSDDYVEWAEFRLLLIYLRQYFEVWKMFDLVDSSDDRRIELSEFEAAIPQFEAWGVEITDAEAAFNEIDANGGGVVLFDEFADWALRKRLDLEDDDDFDFDIAVNSVDFLM